ncbi:MAG: tetratricopeptide repeat protein [Candidatus Zixiibacteriota bacterium]
MIECSKCGSENHFDGAAFCKTCGSQLHAKVAIEIADPVSPLSATTKIQTTKIAAPAADIMANDEFTVEDVTDPADSEAELKKIDASVPEGGIDKLLSLYGNDEPIEEAQAGAEIESASLGIESASDFLLRQQTSSPSPVSTVQPQVENVANPPIDKLSEIQAKLTHIEDTDQQVKNPLGGPRRKKKESSVPNDEKDRLLSSLSKSLHTETTYAPVSEPNLGELNLHIEATQNSNDPEELTFGAPVQDATQLPSLPVVDSDPAIEVEPVVLLRGKNLSFPDDVRLFPGDHIEFHDQKYTIRKGAVDKRSWILGGVLVGVLVIIMIVQSLTAPAPMKATVFGVVTNSETNEVLAGISVTIPQLNMLTVTDEHGIFKFAGVADGRYDVKVEGGLYEARFFPIVIQNNQSDIVYGSVNPILPQSSVSTPTQSSVAEASIPENQPEYGTLKISSNVTDALVLVDGKSLGKVSQTFKRMKPGNRNIVIRAEGYQEVAQVVNIIGGETTELTANLLSLQSNTPVEYTAEDFFEQAETLHAEQKFIEAVGYYTLALAKDNSMVKAYLRRGEAHLQAGKKLNARADYRSAADLYINSGMYSQAIACYDKIIEFQPNASDAYSLRGWAQIAGGNYDDGLRDLQKALSFTPDDTQALFDVGKANYVTNRYKEAEKLLKKIRKHADENPEIYGYLALTQLALGNENDARKSFDAFRKVASSAQVARMSTESGWQRLTALAGN